MQYPTQMKFQDYTMHCFFFMECQYCQNWNYPNGNCSFLAIKCLDASLKIIKALNLLGLGEASHPNTKHPQTVFVWRTG